MEDELFDALEKAVALLWEHCEGLKPHIDELEIVISKVLQKREDMKLLDDPPCRQIN